MHTVKFVDAISGSPTTRLDLNDGTVWLTEYEGTDFTPPRMRRTISSNQLVDGDAVTSAVYENRVLKLDLSMSKSTVDLCATELQKLLRELDRPTNLLQYKPDAATAPVWFRTLRADTDSLREQIGSGNYFEQVVSIPAEPFALGARVALSGGTISGTAASSTEFDFSGISGDVATPLLIGASGTSLQNSIFAFGTRRRGTPPAFGASASGSVLVNSGIGQTIVSAFTWPPSGTSTDYVGDYRVFAKATKSTGATVLGIWVRYAGDLANTQECIANTTSTASRWYDLGVVTVPGGSAGRSDGYGAGLAAAGGSFTVMGRSISGTATFAVSSLYFMPADQELCVVRAPDTAVTYVLDGPNDALYATSSSILQSTGPFSRRGRLPMLSPGSQTTRVAMLNTLQGASPTSTGSGTLTFAYWPRYLYIRPPTT